MKISDRCLFCGFRNQAENYFSLFDIFISPSRSEGFGLTLIEAVKNNVPLICSDINVFKELFNSDEVTFFKLDDRQSLSHALRTVEESGETKVIPALERVKKEYYSTCMAAKYFSLYRSLIV